MELKENIKPERRTQLVHIRTYKSFCEFMNKHELSPSLVFNNAVKELMQKTK